MSEQIELFANSNPEDGWTLSLIGSEQRDLMRFEQAFRRVWDERTYHGQKSPEYLFCIEYEVMADLDFHWNGQIRFQLDDFWGIPKAPYYLGAVRHAAVTVQDNGRSIHFHARAVREMPDQIIDDLITYTLHRIYLRHRCRDSLVLGNEAPHEIPDERLSGLVDLAMLELHGDTAPSVDSIHDWYAANGEVFDTGNEQLNKWSGINYQNTLDPYTVRDFSGDLNCLIAWLEESEAGDGEHITEPRKLCDIIEMVHHLRRRALRFAAQDDRSPWRELHSACWLVGEELSTVPAYALFNFASASAEPDWQHRTSRVLESLSRQCSTLKTLRAHVETHAALASRQKTGNAPLVVEPEFCWPYILTRLRDTIATMGKDCSPTEITDATKGKTDRKYRGLRHLKKLGEYDGHVFDPRGDEAAS